MTGPPPKRPPPPPPPFCKRGQTEDEHQVQLAEYLEKYSGTITDIPEPVWPPPHVHWTGDNSIKGSYNSNPLLYRFSSLIQAVITCMTLALLALAILFITHELWMQYIQYAGGC